MLHIGIDPGTKTGYAEYNSKTDSLILETLNFWSCYDRVSQLDIKTTIVHIEVPRTKRNFQEDKSEITTSNIGGVVRESKLLVDGIERLGFKVYRYHPAGKIDDKPFKAITGYKGQTNQHTRDAGMLAYRANRRLI